jgi:hypothetical protein
VKQGPRGIYLTKEKPDIKNIVRLSFFKLGVSLKRLCHKIRIAYNWIRSIGIEMNKLCLIEKKREFNSLFNFVMNSLGKNYSNVNFSGCSTFLTV